MYNPILKEEVEFLHVNKMGSEKFYIFKEKSELELVQQYMVHANTKKEAYEKLSNGQYELGYTKQ